VMRRMTPEELRERDARWAVEAAQDRARHQRIVDAATGNAPALVVLELHKPAIEGGYRECMGCDYSGYEGEPPTYPCRTVQALEEHYSLMVETIAGDLAPPQITP
jgi:hypothetical protein